MVRTICLDGINVALEVDKVEIDLRGPGLQPCSPDSLTADLWCVDGERWQPLMSFQDGSTLYLHCPPEGEDAPLGYKVDGPRPHRWNITVLPGLERVARLSWEAC